MLKRVRKEDVQKETFVKPDGLLRCLDCWKIYMGQDDRDLSASRMQLKAGSELAAYESDINADQRKHDIRIGEATDAMIDGLPRIHIWAIYRKCSIATVWNFPRAAWIDVLEIAEANLTEKLKKNIATALLF
jgi:hypothetical protein